MRSPRPPLPPLPPFTPLVELEEPRPPVLQTGAPRSSAPPAARSRTAPAQPPAETRRAAPPRRATGEDAGRVAVGVGAARRQRAAEGQAAVGVQRDGAAVGARS